MLVRKLAPSALGQRLGGSCRMRFVLGDDVLYGGYNVIGSHKRGDNHSIEKDTTEASFLGKKYGQTNGPRFERRVRADIGFGRHNEHVVLAEKLLLLVAVLGRKERHA